MKNRKIKVLVVDDSALVRKIIQNGLSDFPDIDVVGTAADPYIARDKILSLRPDVLTLDVEMPRMDGVEFLRKLMPQYPLPVVMVSSLTERSKSITIDALGAGAVDFVSKPRSNISEGLSSMMLELVTKIRIASTTNVSHWKHKKFEDADKQVIRKSLSESTDKVIAIGASTGGTEAIAKVITRFPRVTPGVVIVQHMPAGFTAMFAERMNSLSEMAVSEAKDGDRVMMGRVLIAPGGKQMEIVRSGGVYRVKVYEGDLVCGHCPSVEVMMDSVAREVGSNAIGVMLTGMGSDGSGGMKRMADAGAQCIAQDEATSVVFGMPKEAYVKGGAKRLVAIDNIAASVLNMLS